MNLLADLQVAGPDALLAAFGLVGLLLGAVGGDRIAGLLRLLAVAAMAAAAVLSAFQFAQGDQEAFGGLYRISAFVLFAKTATYALGAAALFMSGGFLKAAVMERYEY